jgi:NTP pyrophosphatase (non-canonical NTP hydrolase)
MEPGVGKEPEYAHTNRQAIEQDPIHVNPLDDLKHRLRDFAAERDWEQFHSPKNLAMALIVEAAELVEQFQWLTQAESQALPEQKRAAVEQELADIQIYLVRLADRLGIDLVSAVDAKIQLNAQKYPADKVRGKADKYNECDDGC